MFISYRSFVSCCLMFWLASSAIAATLHVEPWGGSAPDCGGKSAPCATISDAVDQAVPGAKILVGPGVYAETLMLNIEGLRLESKMGANATVIDPNVGPGIVVTANKVRIGKRGKGFSVRDTHIETLAGTEHNRIEGNVIFRGLLKIEGNDHLVRHNQVIDSPSGKCVDIQNAERLQFRQNRIVACANTAIDAFNVSNSIFHENVIMGSGNGGLALGAVATDPDNRVLNNVVLWSGGISLANAGAGRVEGNISTQSHFDGFYIAQNDPGGDIRVKNNLSVSPENAGIIVAGQFAGLAFDGNTAIQSHGDSAAAPNVFIGDVDVRSFRGNNQYADEHGCGITSVGTLLYRRNFFGAPDEPDPDGADWPADAHDAFCGAPPDPASTAANKPNPVKVRKASKL